MKKINIKIISLYKSVEFEISSINNFESLFFSILYLFNGAEVEGRYIVECPLQKDLNFEKRLSEFVDQLKDRDPKINRLKTYFNSIPIDKYFFAVIDKEISKEMSDKLCEYLIAIEEGKDYQEFAREMENFFGEFKRKYSISNFGHQEKVFIGEKDKSKRICRFCKKKSPEVSFKKIAHSISEALGNRLIVTNDECDKCNHDFGISIENDLILYLDFYRSFFEIKGKNGIPTLKGENYSFKKDGERKFILEHYLKEGEEPTSDFNLTLRNNKKITDLNIYKTLVKYALSVVQFEDIPQFEETIKWLRDEIQFSELPRVAVLMDYELYKDHPMLTLYHRKDEDDTLPYLVSEFRFTFLTFVFIIPENSSTNYTKEYYDRFWSVFNHYSGVKGWNFINFSNPVPRDFNVKLNFNKVDRNNEV